MERKIKRGKKERNFNDKKLKWVRQFGDRGDRVFLLSVL